MGQRFLSDRGMIWVNKYTDSWFNDIISVLAMAAIFDVWPRPALHLSRSIHVGRG